MGGTLFLSVHATQQTNNSVEASIPPSRRSTVLVQYLLFKSLITLAACIHRIITSISFVAAE